MRMVGNFEHLTGHITKRKAVGTLRRLIKSELECYSIGTVRSELVDVPDGLTREELDDIGGYGWLCDVDKWDDRMFDEMEKWEVTE